MHSRCLDKAHLLQPLLALPVGILGRDLHGCGLQVDLVFLHGSLSFDDFGIWRL